MGEECTICQVYQKPPPRPAVGLPLTLSFQECVAMGVKLYITRYLTSSRSSCDTTFCSNCHTIKGLPFINGLIEQDKLLISEI